MAGRHERIGPRGEQPAPLVTVVVPTYNSRETLQCALGSIQRQDFSDFEVWIVGDACTDGSERAVEALNDDRFHWVNRTAHSGGSSSPQYREGLSRARGRYVAYLGHDDLWFPWHLSSLIEEATRSGSSLVHALCAILGPDGWVQIAGPPESGSYRRHFMPPSSWLHERELAIRVGGWRDADALAGPNDLDLLQRFVDTGARISCSARLSALKWPSAFWKSYAPDAKRPQLAVAADMARDPRALAERILNDFALALSRRTWRDRARTVRGEWSAAASHAWAGARLLARNALQPDGQPRWPFEPLLRRRYQRVRRRMRAVRGLDR